MSSENYFVEVILVKILELILRIVLRLIEALSSKPSEAPPFGGNNGNSNNTNNTTSGDVQSTLNSMGQTYRNPNSTIEPQKSITVYSDEVNELLNQVMAAHRATQEADMNEIIRLRQEISRLQQELILAKASVQSSKNITFNHEVNKTTQTFQGTDVNNESHNNDITG